MRRSGGCLERRRVPVIARWAVIVATSAGCFTKPPAPSTSDGGVRDASVDAPAPCAVRDNFSTNVGGTEATACGSWGEYKGNGTHIVTRNQMGQLMFYTTSDQGGTAACSGTTQVPFTNVVVQVPNILDAVGAHTGIELTFGGGTSFKVDIVTTSTTAAEVHTVNGTQAAAFLTNYSGSAMQYFRLSRRGPSALDLSYSSQATMWPTSQPFDVGTNLDVVAVTLYVDFGANVPGFVTATFDNLDGCAP